MRTNGTPNGPAACASSHRQRRKWWTALAVLAVLVVLGTVAALTMPASTMSVADMATPETAAAAENGQAADAPARDPNAPAPAENTPAATAPAATPAPATPESAEPAAAEYTAALGEGADALNVVVTAPAGAFDEGVEPVLQVTALESEQDLQAIAAELDGHEVAYDGFAALDITFTDAQGQEIEPKLPVKVRMELPQAVVDSGIDLTTLTVQHLAEDDQGNVTSVDQVASVAGNTITLSDAAAAAVNEAAGIATMSINALTAESAEAPVVAEFEVDGFSSFVITWGSYTSSTSLDITCIDNATGEPLPDGVTPDGLNKDKRNGDAIRFVDTNTELAIDGYTFVKAEYSMDGNTWNTLDSLSATYNVRLDFWKSYWSYAINGNQDVTAAPKVRLLYDKDGGDNPGGGDTPGGGGLQPGFSKEAVLQNDGTYDLTLSVTGAAGTQDNPAKVDLLMIVDTSGSMQGKRLTNTKNAMRTMITTLENPDLYIDAQYDIVTFSGPSYVNIDGSEDDADVATAGRYSNNGWCDANTAQSAINSLNANGGTNYQAGLRAGADQLSKAREGATKIVVFLSDGNPTLYIGGGDGQTSLNRYGSGWSSTLQEAKTINCDIFYSIRIGNANANYLTDIRDNVSSKQPAQYISAESDGSNLSEIFAGIAGSITQMTLTDVTITDPLSEHVEAVLDADGNPVKLEVKVTDKNGNDVTSQISEIQQDPSLATEDNIYPAFAEGKLTLNFPDDYKLNPDYTYSVTLNIKPSASAEIAYAQNASYSDLADSATGTHSKNYGFYSNNTDTEKATLTYSTVDQDDQVLDTGSAEYKMPVVQVQRSYLKLEKKLAEGTTVEGGTEFTFLLSIDKSLAGTYNAWYSNDGETLSQVTFTENGDTATASVSLAPDEYVYIALPQNTAVTITENTEEYTKAWAVGEVNSSGDSVTATTPDEAGKQIQVTCTNEAIPQTTDLTIHKVGLDNIDLSGAEFTLTNEDGKYYTPNGWSDTSISLTPDSDNTSYFHISGLANGTYTLTETKAPDGYQMLTSSVQITVEAGVARIEPTANVAIEGNVITVTNTTGTELPETGGRGTNFLTIGGLLMMAAAAGGYVLRRRRGKEAR